MLVPLHAIHRGQAAFSAKRHTRFAKVHQVKYYSYEDKKLGPLLMICLVDKSTYCHKLYRDSEGFGNLELKVNDSSEG